MILSFRDQATEDFYNNRPTHRAARFPANIRSIALRKLDILNAAHRLEALKGDLSGFFSIRVNDQWQLTFRWENNNAHDVALVDYH